MPPKRKVKDAALEEPKDAPRRSSRRISTREVNGDATAAASDSPPAKKSKNKGSKVIEKKEEEEEENFKGEEEEDEKEKEEKKPKPTKSAKPAKANKPVPKATTGNNEPTAPTGRQYWLMKAEPESRIEKGHDIKFSIDDLAAKTEPEPWDGIRNYAARNNLRAMKKGDLAFFYHSSCKIPAIVGIMEIVEEAIPDLSAHDASLPYYDPNSKPSDPKWSMVHVEFRQKLKTPITLKELREWYAVKDHDLGQMQMLKLARMSVSKVSEGEWEFLVAEMKERGDVLER